MEGGYQDPYNINIADIDQRATGRSENLTNQQNPDLVTKAQKAGANLTLSFSRRLPEVSFCKSNYTGRSGRQDWGQ